MSVIASNSPGSCAKRQAMRLSMLVFIYFAVLFPALQGMPRYVLVFSLILMGLFVWVSLIDIQTFTIPDAAIALMVLTGSISLFLISPALVLAHLGGGFIGFLFFWGIGIGYLRLRKKDGLGMGDAKLFGAGLVWVGLDGAPSVVFLAALSGLLFGYVNILLGRMKYNTKIPFGPFLSLATFVTWVHGPILS